MLKTIAIETVKMSPEKILGLRKREEIRQWIGGKWQYFWRGEPTTVKELINKLESEMEVN